MIFRPIYLFYSSTRHHRQVNIFEMQSEHKTRQHALRVTKSKGVPLIRH